jgi:hypothetical protein
MKTYKNKVYLRDAAMDVEVTGAVDGEGYVDILKAKQIDEAFEPFGNWLDVRGFSVDDKKIIEEALIVAATAFLFTESEELRMRAESMNEDRILEQFYGVKG